MKPKLLLLFTSLIFCCYSLQAQDSAKNNKFQYRIKAGFGIGTGYPHTEYYDGSAGISGCLEFAIQKKKMLYAVGVNSVGELQIISTSNVTPTVSSVDLKIGRVLKEDNIFISVNAGAGLVITEIPGKLISSGGGFFTQSKYERMSFYTIGIPISAQFFYIPKNRFGIGLELYANFNSHNTFYEMNLCFEFGRLKKNSF